LADIEFEMKNFSRSGATAQRQTAFLASRRCAAA
jgi:hypothetical protein